MKSQIQSISLQRKPRSISTFLKKTYELLNDEQNKDVVRWGPNGIGFVVLNEEIFSRELLPKYFKHRNYSSFVRQLNMYNFHKIRQNNSMNFFHHDCFDRHNEFKLVDIKRKPEKKKKKNGETDEEIQSDNEQRENNKGLLDIRIKQEISQENNQQEVCQVKQEEEHFTRHFVSSQNNGSSLCQTWKHLQEEVDDDKLSINNDISERVIPRMATRELIYPSSNNLFPFRMGQGQTSTFCIFY